eukprot:SAG31_NODE_9419_length_1280_cov_1.593565_1_plen_142_part_00
MGDPEGIGWAVCPVGATATVLDAVSLDPLDAADWIIIIQLQSSRNSTEWEVLLCFCLCCVAGAQGVEQFPRAAGQSLAAQHPGRVHQWPHLGLQCNLGNQPRRRRQHHVVATRIQVEFTLMLRRRGPRYGGGYSMPRTYAY